MVHEHSENPFLLFFWDETMKKKEPYLYVIPALIAILLVVILPLIYSLYMCFHNYNLTTGRPPSFSGITNFLNMIYDARFLNSLKVTALFSTGAVTIELLLGLGIALLMGYGAKLSSVIKTIFTLIIVTPSIVAGYMWKIMFDSIYGPLNYILNRLFGFPANFEWTSNVNMVIPSLIMVDVWQWTPFVSLVLLAGIYSIPIGIQEAARIDGASSFQLFRHIILPIIKPLILVILLIRFMDAIKLFDMVFILTKGGPGTASEIISFYTYIVAFKNFDIGYASAISWVTVILIEVICLIFIHMLRRVKI